MISKKLWKKFLRKGTECLYSDIDLGGSYCVRSPSSFVCAQLTSISPARDRIGLLLDQDSPFLEVGAFAGFRNPDSTPAANLIAGIGNVWWVYFPPYASKN